MTPRLLRSMAAETIGAYVLVLAGTGAIASDARSQGMLGHPGVAITFGLAIMVMIYAVGHISGAHFNPAVTIAFAVGRHFPFADVLSYWFAQVTGAILGSLTVTALIDTSGGNGVTRPTVFTWQAFVLEALLTYILMFVIMAVSTDTRAVGQAAAIAIGGTVALEALFAGPLTGASMNPARSLGPALVAGEFDGLWIYLLAPILGAVAGALSYGWIGLQKNGT